MGSDESKKIAATEFGKEAEQIAVDYLLGLGYTIRERNWSGISRRFEVDIIAQENDNIIFVEVKARKGDHQDPLEAIDLKKMRQLVRAADAYMGNLDNVYYYRFDVISIVGNRESYSLQHFPNAFLSPLSSSYR